MTFQTVFGVVQKVTRAKGLVVKAGVPVSAERNERGVLRDVRIDWVVAKGTRIDKSDTASY